eukprot:TRINITY_DN2812_c0_g2_i1.p1 TRINITY_DN2812_c0_g2~~TRINITY_DN2812_c0_g2_i1.p1  ORF type:complete len:435 (+),score=45.79 TRINITY_DN2812_c0_g2_i1:177-1481(+)
MAAFPIVRLTFFIAVLLVFLVFFKNIFTFQSNLCENQLSECVDKVRLQENVHVDDIRREVLLNEQCKDTLESEKKERERLQYAVENLSRTIEMMNTSSVEESVEGQRNVNIPVLVITCNRVDVLRKSLDSLLRYRPSANFPIIVSQDCGNEDVSRVLVNEFSTTVAVIKHPFLTKVDSYTAISRHYKWALSQIFDIMNFGSVIIVEDDMEVSPDFFEYFIAGYHLLNHDPTIYCISSWNDNGLAKFAKDPKAIYRTDMFPGLGWMMKKDLWDQMKGNWPISYWDEYLREPAVRKGRSCIRPEISRNYNLGEQGVSSGQFYKTHIKNIPKNTEFVRFSEIDMTYMIKEYYDKWFGDEVLSAEVVTFEEAARRSDKNLRIIYRSLEEFQNLAKRFGIMSDEKLGIPRTAYKGVVTFRYESNTIFLTRPEINFDLES